MAATGVVLGFYRDEATAREALRELRRQDLGQSAAIFKSPGGRARVEDKGISPRRGAFYGVSAGAVLGAAVSLLPPLRAARPALVLGGAIAGTLGGFVASRHLDFGVSGKLLARYGRWLVNDETLVVIQARPAQMERALAVLRETGNQSPAIFVMRPTNRRLEREEKKLDRAPSVAGESDANLSTVPAASSPREPLTAERLQARARRLASSHRVTRKKVAGQPLLIRLKRSEGEIEAVRASLEEAARLEQSVSISGEWLLDNAYLVQGQIKDVRRNLPRRYYNQLPVLVEASAQTASDKKSSIAVHLAKTAGTPRVYAIATDLIANTDAHLERGQIVDFLRLYQEVTPLSMGELWAAPLMLRLALIERLRGLTVRIEERQRERERADFWANRLRHAARRDPDQLLSLLTDLTRERDRVTPHFADRLRSQLLDEEGALNTVQNWLEGKLDAPLAEIIQSEARRQVSDQVSISNIIGSLRALLDLDWREVFEETSVVHSILREDPSGVYAQMDFSTRDRYRHVVEGLSRYAKTRKSEPDVARAAVEMARASDVPAQNGHGLPSEVAKSLAIVESVDETPLHLTHVGFFLIDDGRPVLEKQVGYAPRFLERARRWSLNNAAKVYLGGVAAITVGGLAWLSRASSAHMSTHVATLALAVLPISDLAAQAFDYLLTRLLPPRGMAKMSFEHGIPDNAKTLVVVPMMLMSNDGIREDVERLQVRFLANSQPNIQYALLSDFADAAQERMPEDEALLQTAIDGIEALNARHKADTFFLFHRERKWAEGEGKWIGHERKRGKLEEMNAFLCAEPVGANSDILRVGTASTLAGIRFVITLDADTQLPHDSARRMIETLAHPLNRPVIKYADAPHMSTHVAGNGRALYVERGYGIIQPLVSTALPSAVATRFSRLMTDPRGTDPYTSLSSNVYQDLSGEGAYHGKGMYDLHAFHRVLSGRFPDGTLLSHDLIEGAHVRVGLATDIELFDQFPANYLAYAKRQHRWIRGDWQISDWAFNRVPSGNGERETNVLSTLNKWKIFDNLRRSWVPVSSMALLLSSWFVAPAASQSVGAIIGFTAVLPALTQLLTWISSRPWTQPFPARTLEGTLCRALFNIALLPHQAGLALDAVTRVQYRRRVSRRNLLEWQTAQVAQKSSQNLEKSFIRRLALVSLASFGLALTQIRRVALKSRPASIAEPLIRALYVATPFLISWAASPLLVKWLSGGRRASIVAALPASDKTKLRQIARETWRYFDDFIGPQSNWLPPDNYQEHLNIEVAPRTSPTNIGLWLLSALAARNFGYITLDQVADRTLATVETLENLERHDGHLLNWYDTTTAAPLHPRYVSTVDSGNLLVSLWAFNQGCLASSAAPVLDASALRGLQDTLAIFRNQEQQLPPVAAAHVETLHRLFDLSNQEDAAHEYSYEGTLRLDELISRLRNAGEPAYALTRALREEGAGSSFDPHIYWADALERQVASWNSVIDRYLPWAPLLASHSEQQWFALGGEAAVAARHDVLQTAPSLRSIAQGEVAALSSLLRLGFSQNALEESGASFEEMAALRRAKPEAWVSELADAGSKARWLAGEMLGQIETLVERCEKLGEAMDMRPLYNARRKVFTIGLNVGEGRLDNSYYDSLASECRLASFAAIARGDVPVEHWLKLQRLYATSGKGGSPALMSWSGTMFEYLMPLLLTHNYENSLLDYACRAAVARQIEYGRHRGIPWGISEAAYSALDAGKTYQYQAFGVPGLGLKRGLEDDLVVAPYATALALLVDPVAAMANLNRLEEIGMRGGYGFYESIDYTRARVPEGERGVIVRAFMVHHQGMSLLAFDNLLNGGATQNYFHADPRVQATAPLLYESVPIAPPLLENTTRESGATRLEPLSAGPSVDEFQTPDTPTPRVNLLSNGNYSLMVTNAGGGYSRWRDMDITRFRSDPTRDNWGSFCYGRDLDEGFVWSNTFHPVGRRERRYNVTFAADRAEFKRRDAEIETRTEIIVSPEDDAEIRRVTLTNLSKRTRRIELTSYLELALAPHAADRAHPAFAKLFIQTEAVPERGALLAWRRPRSPKDTPVWAAHVLTTDNAAHEYSYNSASPNGAASMGLNPDGTVAQPVSNTRFQFETDRAKFIGRGRDASNPQALEGELSNTQGAVLDPVFSLRRRVVLQPGQSIQVAFVTLAGETRGDVMHLVEKYSDMGACARAFELAWTNAQLEMYRLRLEPEDGQWFQQLAGHMIYPHAQLRASSRRIKLNQLGQSHLWAYGISGDLPTLVLSIESERDLRLVRQVLMAHTFWRARGLKTDLVILNEEAEGYEQPLSEQLKRLAQAHSPDGLDQPGGVFLRNAKQLPPDDLNLLMTVARVVLVAARGSLAQQLSASADDLPRLVGGIVKADEKSSRARLGRAASDGKIAPRLVINQRLGEEPSAPLPFMELPYFNGLGGFTPDGREYAIYLGPDDVTPAPWINVMANERTGVVLSESGSGYSWCDNSQANRLTPWNNDPVSDPATEAIYIRDDETGKFWTPTALPVRELDPYRTRHGQGYTVFEHNSHAIEQELIVFVPVDEEDGAHEYSCAPVRIQRLRLRNRSSRRRRLSVMSYAEWTLGTTREETATNIVTNWDATNGILTARNAYHPDYSRRVSFVAAGPAPRSFSGDRTEFLGRNGTPARPGAMTRQSLSGRVGAALDPCAALQVTVEIEPGQDAEIIFLMGQADDAAQAARLAHHFLDGEVVEKALNATSGFWDRLLDTVQVHTPDLAVNFLVNRWLLYQDLSCRIWARSALYQSGGAFGFRDQLQDVLALVHARPQVAREQIVRASGHQFLEGDVQHWWHPPSGAGVRTRFSDDLLWLPFVVSHYIRTTGDNSVLDEIAPFLEAAVLGPDEHESYISPQVSSQTASIFEHCVRAIDKGLTSGAHGLPLIGIGDWNDGMSRVGVEGRGESVWLAWFLVEVLNGFADLCEERGDGEQAEKRRAQAVKMAQTVEEQAWDGNWYRRAYFDDGSPLGSHLSEEAKIDSLAQTWGILCGAGDNARSETAMRAVDEYLIREDDKMILLFTPPFDKSSQDPGYIKGYVPGVRENGGQYTHAAIWVAQAYARKGDGEMAVRMLSMLNPVEHARTQEDTQQYKVEPYVVAADVYALQGRVGQGGWTWYTGSASWMYRVWLEDVLGFQRRGETLFIQPNIPRRWNEYSMSYRFGATQYHIAIENTEREDVENGVAELEVDGEIVAPEAGIALKDDGVEHRVRVRLGAHMSTHVAALVSPEAVQAEAVVETLSVEAQPTQSVEAVAEVTSAEEPQAETTTIEETIIEAPTSAPHLAIETQPTEVPASQTPEPLTQKALGVETSSAQLPIEVQAVETKAVEIAATEAPIQTDEVQTNGVEVQTNGVKSGGARKNRKGKK